MRKLESVRTNNSGNFRPGYQKGVIFRPGARQKGREFLDRRAQEAMAD
jgi:hypothetical protein